VKVFFSWSGDRSKAVAEGLGGWLAQVIQAVEPWISSGIEKGARWQSEIAERLDEAKVGIVCLTSGNLTAPWILFEAGALSKTKDSYVCTFLLDITRHGDVEPPLGQFQHTLFTREDVFKLVQTINEVVKTSGERSLNDKNLLAVFETFWPQLETLLTQIRNQKEAKPAPRQERDLLEEMLEILRNQEQRVRKELEEKESARQVAQYLGYMTSDTAPTSNRGLDLFQQFVKEQQKKLRDKILSAPTEIFEKEPSNVDPSKK
jgi:hypothetical protein